MGFEYGPGTDCCLQKKNDATLTGRPIIGKVTCQRVKPPKCNSRKPTWFCRRDRTSFSHYPTCHEVNYNRLCCIPRKAYKSRRKQGRTSCGRYRCLEGKKGVVDDSRCEQPAPLYKVS